MQLCLLLTAELVALGGAWQALPGACTSGTLSSRFTQRSSTRRGTRVFRFLQGAFERRCNENQERSTKLCDIHFTHAKTLYVTAYHLYQTIKSRSKSVRYTLIAYDYQLYKLYG